MMKQMIRIRNRLILSKFSKTCIYPWFPKQQLGKYILKVVDSTITGSKIRNRYKNVVWFTGFNLNLEDFPQLPRIVPVRNSVSFSKSIINVVSTSSIRPGKPIFNINLQVNQLVLVFPVQVNPLVIRLVFSRFSDLGGNLGTVKEKPTKKIWSSHEKSA